MDTTVIILMALGLPVASVLYAWRWMFTTDEEERHGEE